MKARAYVPGENLKPGQRVLVRGDSRLFYFQSVDGTCANLAVTPGGPREAIARLWGLLIVEDGS